ncbi:ubx domain-containing protein [Anaeramoeba flamelloides]|uniref:Ubx domain-containing protein n=1 Tax=Anaeramoeba flamelloides TaxID=1746091 RepID=A0AAV8A839_9EUKA|nr:ubx domain-containing protein [Anaeramoeba flamelloides]
MYDLTFVEQNLVLKFQSETKTEEKIAIHFLSSANYDYQTAVSLYEQTYGTKKRRTVDYRKSDRQAKALLEKEQEQELKQTQGNYHLESSFGSTLPKRRSTRIYLKTVNNSMKTQFGKYDKQKIARKFKPPYDLFFQGTFEDAKQLGSKKLKWIMVNLQSSTCSSSLQLNKDLWEDVKVKRLIKEKFLFFQFYQNEPEYIQYNQYYPYTPYNTKGIFTHYKTDNEFEETILPRIDFIDPRTGERKFWFIAQNLSKNAIISQTTKFLDQNVLMSLVDPSELDLEKQIQIAIAESTENYQNQVKKVNKEKEKEKEKGIEKKKKIEMDINIEIENEKDNKKKNPKKDFNNFKDLDYSNFENYGQFDFSSDSTETETDSESETESESESESETGSESESDYETETGSEPENKIETEPKSENNSKQKKIHPTSIKINNKTEIINIDSPIKTKINQNTVNRKRHLEKIDDLWWRKEPDIKTEKNVVPIKILLPNGDKKIFNFYQTETIDIIFKTCIEKLKQFSLNTNFELYDLSGITKKALSIFRKKTIKALSLGNSLLAVSLK